MALPNYPINTNQSSHKMKWMVWVIVGNNPNHIASAICPQGI